MKSIKAWIGTIAATVCVFCLEAPVMAAKVDTNVLPGDLGIDGILKLIVKILVYGIGVAAVLGVVISGILYLTARDNESQVAAAKKRLYEVVIGLVLWMAMFSILKWLIPGGVDLL